MPVGSMPLAAGRPNSLVLVQGLALSYPLGLSLLPLLYASR